MTKQKPASDKLDLANLKNLMWNWLGVLIILASAWFLWPTSLGGRTQFVVVQGASMEPTYHSGDLLYARSSGGYQVDDVVVYTIPEGSLGTGAHVVHRITALDGDGNFVMTGDNKLMADDARPSARDVVASPVANLGQFPTRLLILTPLILSLIFGCAVAWFLWPESLTEPDQSRTTPVA